jgi:hypothetical protein
MDHLGLRYLHAHQIATRAEQAAVRAAGISWHAYDRFMRMYVKSIGDARVSKVPRDLDLKPTRMNTMTSSCAGWRQRSTKDRCPWVFVPIACVIAAILAHHRNRALPRQRLVQKPAGYKLGLDEIILWVLSALPSLLGVGPHWCRRLRFFGVHGLSRCQAGARNERG